MTVVLALLSSILWGAADFAGGTASRRRPALWVVATSQATGLAGVSIVAIIAGAWRSPLGYLPWGIAAGLVGAGALVLFYRALAIGTMGVVSPIAALSVVIPVAVSLISGHLPSPVVGVGFVLAVVGVLAASGPERAQGRSARPAVLAALSAVGFGATLLFIAQAAQYSPLMTMVTMRAASVPPLALIYLATRHRQHAAPVDTDRHRGSGQMWPLVLLAGLLDVSANLAFAAASVGAVLAVVAILGSLYPAVTVVLARMMLGERLTRLQQVGLVLALAGIALIAG